MLKRLVLAVVLLVVVFLVAVRVRNPERATLDAAARAGAPGQFVALDDGVTHYQVAGPDSGQRVVLVHGFSVPSYIWDSTFLALSAAGFRVARYDLFGRGFSDRPDADYTVDFTDRQLSQLLDSLGWREPVDLIGLSYGGVVTGAFAGRHPERVRSLVLVDPAAGAAGSLPAMFRLPLLGGALWQLLAVPGMADNQLSDFVEPAKWPDWPDRYRVQMRYRGFGRALRSTILHRAGSTLDTLYARVGAAGTRSLLIWGTEDSTVSITEAAGVRQAIPQIRFVPVEGAGHLPHMERTDLVNPLLIEFLRTPSGVAGQQERGG